MNEWKSEIASIYESFPKKLKNYKNKVLFKSIALDWLLLKDFEEEQPLAFKVVEAVLSLGSPANSDSISRLEKGLDEYYAWRRDDGRWEKKTFFSLNNFPIYPTFILSYNRPGRNATLNCFEKWNNSEVFENTMVFIQPEQEDEYKKNHPKFYFYGKSVSSVGERFLEVLKFCKHWGIRYFFILEDDIQQFRYIKKGGVSGNSHLSKTEEDCGSCYLRYYAKTALKMMKYDSLCAFVGLRNRVMANNESSSIIGYHDPMRGGCPNMTYFIDLERFWPIYKIIPKEHYTPQSDWAIQCATVKMGLHWGVITGMVKNEYNSKSVIGFTGDRESLAAEMIHYYGVEDLMSYRRFKDTEMQGVKIFYSPKGYDEKMNEKLF